MKRVSKILIVLALITIVLWHVPERISASSKIVDNSVIEDKDELLESEYSIINMLGNDPSKVVTTDMDEVNVLLKDESVTDVYYVDLDLLKMIM